MTVANYSLGIYTYYSDDVTLINNTAYDMNGTGFYVIESTYPVLLDNTAYDNSQDGFYIYTDSNYSILTNNTAHDNSQHGFYIRDSNHGTFTENFADNNTDTGFYFHISENNTFYNNTARNSSFAGLQIFQGSSDNNFTSNIITLNDDYGVLVSSNSHNNIFNSNNVTDGTFASGSGISILGSQNTSLSDNLINDNTNIGIYLSSTTNTTFSSNTISSNDEGVELYNSNITSFTEDHFFGNTQSLRYGQDDTNNRSLSLTNVIFDNVAGNYQNFSNISMTHNPETVFTYYLNWTTNSSIIPTNLTSFNEKYLEINPVSGSSIIESIVWHWTDAELAGYTEANLELWKYNGSWSNAGAGLTAAANTLTLTSFLSSK